MNPPFAQKLERAAAHETLPLALQLREATGEQHRELEAEVDIERRISDRAAYRELLEKFYGFYLPMEQGFTSSATAAHAELDLAARKKSGWLEEDLRALGVSDLTALPMCRALPPLQSWPQILGAMYVLEGSTLGGRQIAGLMETHAQLALPGRFFRGYAEQTGARWRAFGEILNEVNTPAECASAIASARATFACLRQWLST